MANTAPNAVQVTYIPSGGRTATNVQAAIDEVVALLPSVNSGVTFANVAAMKAATPPIDGTVATLSGYYTPSDGGEGQFVYVGTSSVTPDDGIFFLPNSAPATGRWTRIFQRDHLSVRWYGAKGDGTTDDTTAVQNAINAGISYQISIRVPAGTYIVQPLTYPSVGYSSQISIYGDDQSESILKKKSGASTAPVLTIGSASATNFTSGVTVEKLTFDGLSKTASTDAVKTYDIVRTVFNRCIFKNAGGGFTGLGGIYVTFNDCSFDACNIGCTFDKFTSLAGGGWPNGITLNSCLLLNNSTWGIWFDSGRLLTLNQCEIEGNGTNGVNTTGGVRIGANIGQEVIAYVPTSTGARIRDCWCEANAGAASIVLLGGKNIVNSSYFVFNPQSTFDIYISGGNYYVDNCLADMAKSPNLFEDSGVSTGNWINASVLPNITYSTLKTRVDYGQTNRCVWSFHNNGTDYSASVGAATEMSFSTTDLLSGGTKSGNGFVVNTAGTYRVNVQVQINSVGNGGQVTCAIYKNGVSQKQGVAVTNTTGGATSLQTSLSCLVQAAAGDTITARYYTSVGPTTVEGDAVVSYFQGELV